IVERSLGAPLGHSSTRAFTLSSQVDSDDQQLFIVAQGLAGEIRDRRPPPIATGSCLGLYGLTVRTAQPREPAPLVIRQQPQPGRGWDRARECGVDVRAYRDDLTYLQKTVISSGLVNQVQVLAGYEHEPTMSASPLPGLVFNGAFSVGGAQSTL